MGKGRNARAYGDNATDNWYSSIPLALKCLEKNVHLTGTIKSGRKGVPTYAQGNNFMKAPKRLKPGQRAPKKLTPPKRGELVAFKMKNKESVDDPGPAPPPGSNIYFTSWFDKKPVHIISTFVSGVSYCGRMVKEKVMGAGKEGTEWVKKSFPIPTIIKHYNYGMGGTDGHDQAISYYFPHIKSVAWANRIFIHMLMVSVANAYLIWFWLKKKPNGAAALRYRRSEFIEELAQELAAEHLAANAAAKVSTPARSTPGSNKRGGPPEGHDPEILQSSKPRKNKK